jgi:hypothetical protein
VISALPCPVFAAFGVSIADPFDGVLEADRPSYEIHTVRRSARLAQCHHAGPLPQAASRRCLGGTRFLSEIFAGSFDHGR